MKVIFAYFLIWHLKILSPFSFSFYDDACTPHPLYIMEQIWLQKRPRNGSKWSTEYYICYYVSNCSSWSVVFKSSVCHLGKPGITPVFKMASKMAVSYRNATRNEIACPVVILCIIFGFKMQKTLSKWYQCIVKDINRLLLQYSNRNGRHNIPHGGSSVSHICIQY